jgi:hypothetical protein
LPLRGEDAVVEVFNAIYEEDFLGFSYGTYTPSPLSIFHHPSLQPLANQADHAPVGNPMLDKSDQPVVADRVEKGSDVDL